jgi:hypothetical protein
LWLDADMATWHHRNFTDRETATMLGLVLVVS